MRGVAREAGVAINFGRGAVGGALTVYEAIARGGRARRVDARRADAGGGRRDLEDARRSGERAIAGFIPIDSPARGPIDN